MVVKSPASVFHVVFVFCLEKLFLPTYELCIMEALAPLSRSILTVFFDLTFLVETGLDFSFFFKTVLDFPLFFETVF